MSIHIYTSMCFFIGSWLHSCATDLPNLWKSMSLHCDSLFLCYIVQYIQPQSFHWNRETLLREHQRGEHVPDKPPICKFVLMHNTNTSWVPRNENTMNKSHIFLPADSVITLNSVCRVVSTWSEVTPVAARLLILPHLDNTLGNKKTTVV